MSEHDEPEQSTEAVNATVSTRYFWLILPPTVIFLVGEAIQEELHSPVHLTIGSIGLASDPPARMLREASGRLDALTSLFAASVIAITMTGMFFCQLLRRFDRGARIALSSAFFGCMIFVLAVQAGTTGGHPCGDPTGHAWSVYGLRSNAPGTGDEASALCRDLRCQDLQCQLNLLRVLLNISTLVLSCAAISMVCGLIGSLFVPGVLETLSSWKERVERARHWLMAGAIMLVSGLVFHQAWGRWLGAGVGSAFEREYLKLVASYTAAKGVEFSLFLAAIALPVFVILAMQGRKVEQPKGRKRPPNRRTNHDDAIATAVLSTSDLLKMALAILAPFFTALISPMAEILKTAAP